jgi:hypothetical protein
MKLLIIVFALIVAGCTTPSAITHSQVYRPAGQDQAMTIQGAISGKMGLISTDYSVFVRIDNVTRMGLKLSPNGSGELMCPKGSAITGCSSLPDRDLSLTCNGSTENRRLRSVTCFVFVDNEKATTLTFN